MLSKLYSSELGLIQITTTPTGLAGLTFIEDASQEMLQASSSTPAEHAHMKEALQWLDSYFAGNFASLQTPTLDVSGNAFRKQVWTVLTDCAPGSTTTYKELAQRVAQANHTRPCAQAVGGALAHNPILLVVPCHRVLGSNGSLTGFAAGLWRKRWLLEHEGIRL